MATVPKKAARVGTLVFTHGGKTDLYLDYNLNTGEHALYQVFNKRTTKNTGRNLRALVGEILQVLREGNAAWEQPTSQQMLNCVIATELADDDIARMDEDQRTRGTRAAIIADYLVVTDEELRHAFAKLVQ